MTILTWEEPPVTARLVVRSATAKFHIEVDPSARRQGRGTAMLAQLTESARGHGVPLIYAWADKGSAGEVFLASRMQRVRAEEIWSTLDLTSVSLPASTMDLLVWEGPCPPGLLDAYTLCHQQTEAIVRGSDGGPEVVSPELIAAMESAATDRWITVAAMEDGRMTGFGQSEITGTSAHQEWTGVVPSHRSRGLGTALKHHMIRELTAREVTELRTENNAANAHILAANDRLGFQPYQRLTAWETLL